MTLNAKPPRFFGLHHYRYEGDGEKSRVHLRIDADGTGTMIVNASRRMHLNPIAARMAYLILEQKTDTEAVKTIRQVYRVPARSLRNDLQEFRAKLVELIRPDGACPIHDLDLESLAPFSSRPCAPYRMDLALTYRCNNDCTHCYNARERNHPELNTGEWMKIITRLWDLGIPHVVFTGGEPTLREDLPELITYAEQKGQITGLNTNGRRLAHANYIDRLTASGLDHVQITVESCDETTHDQMVSRKGALKQTLQGLENALKSKLFVMTNTTMLRNNLDSLPRTLDYLADLGVKTIGLNALIYSGAGRSVGTGLKEMELQPILDMAVKKTSDHGQSLIWYTPTQYCNFDPTMSNLGVKGCTASLYSMCIESNGDVIPCQSYYQSLGNILNAPWESIWNHPLSVQLRERQDLPTKCSACPVVTDCGGGCPLKFETELAKPEEIYA